MLEEEVTPQELTCVIAQWDAALLDVDLGDENQAHINCIGDVANRANMCFDNVSMCGEEHTSCALLFFAGIDGFCDEGALELVMSAGETCFDGGP